MILAICRHASSLASHHIYRVLNLRVDFQKLILVSLSSATQHEIYNYELSVSCKSILHDYVYRTNMPHPYQCSAVLSPHQLDYIHAVMCLYAYHWYLPAYSLSIDKLEAK